MIDLESSFGVEIPVVKAGSDEDAANMAAAAAAVSASHVKTRKVEKMANAARYSNNAFFPTSSATPHPSTFSHHHQHHPHQQNHPISASSLAGRSWSVRQRKKPLEYSHSFRSQSGRKIEVYREIDDLMAVTASSDPQQPSGTITNAAATASNAAATSYRQRRQHSMKLPSASSRHSYHSQQPGNTSLSQRSQHVQHTHQSHHECTQVPFRSPITDTNYGRQIPILNSRATTTNLTVMDMKQQEQERRFAAADDDEHSDERRSPTPPPPALPPTRNSLLTRSVTATSSSHHPIAAQKRTRHLSASNTHSNKSNRENASFHHSQHRHHHHQHETEENEMPAFSSHYLEQNQNYSKTAPLSIDNLPYRLTKHYRDGAVTSAQVNHISSPFTHNDEHVHVRRTITTKKKHHAKIESTTNANAEPLRSKSSMDIISSHSSSSLQNSGKEKKPTTTSSPAASAKQGGSHTASSATKKDDSFSLDEMEMLINDLMKAVGKEEQNRTNSTSNNKPQQSGTTTTTTSAAHPGGTTSRVTEDIETVSLQPIGKGVHDLSSSSPAAQLLAADNRSHKSAVMTNPGSAAFDELQTSPIVTMTTTTTNNYHHTQHQQQPSGSMSATLPHRNLHQHHQQQQQPQLNLHTYQPAPHPSHPGSTSSARHNGNGARNSDNSEIFGSPLHALSHDQQNKALSVAGSSSRGYQSVRHQKSSTMTTGGKRDEFFVNDFSTGEIGLSLKAVQNSIRQWYWPNASRDDVGNHLIQKPPGSFIIRDSKTYPGYFGLGLRVSSADTASASFLGRQNSGGTVSETIRHFLIEPVTMSEESGTITTTGIRLKDLPNENIFENMAQFVYHHIQTPGGLPIKLVVSGINCSTGTNRGNTAAANNNNHHQGVTMRSSIGEGSHFNMNLGAGSVSGSGVRSTRNSYFNTMSARTTTPQKSTISTPDVFVASQKSTVLGDGSRSVIDVNYLGKIIVDRTGGSEAIRTAVSKMTQSNRESIEVRLIQVAGEGITLVDKFQQHFVRKQIPASTIMWVGYDPLMRTYTTPKMQKMNIENTKIFGIVVRKKKLLLHEGCVHLFSELDPTKSTDSAIQFAEQFFH